LQFADLVAENPNITQFADSGRDRVRQLIPGHDLVDHAARQIHALAGIWREQYRLARYCDLAHILQSEIVSSDV
jgi:hypothetical protein